MANSRKVQNEQYQALAGLAQWIEHQPVNQNEQLIVPEKKGVLKT